MRLRFLLPLLIALASPASAQDPNADPRSAALNLGLGAKICLTNYRTPDALQNAFTTAGFTVSPSFDAGVFDVSAHGVAGGFDSRSGYCYLMTAVVPLETTQTLTQDLAASLFPGMIQPGHPETGMESPCNGVSIFAPQKLIWMHYAAAGNSGDCIFNGTSAVIID